MSRQLMLALASLIMTAALVNGGEKKPDSVSAKAAQDLLVNFDKNWKDYTNEPHLGDPRWKLKMETLVKLAKAGRTASPLLEQAAKENSAWAPHTRELAAHFIRVSHDTLAVRDAWANYDLTQIDVARVGKQAPDFTLADASGQSYRLSEYRGKKTIVVTFILQDI